MQMIDRGQQEVMLIRLDYIGSVCDQLLREVESKRMRNRVNDSFGRDSEFDGNDNKSVDQLVKMQRYYRQELLKDKQQYIKKSDKIEEQISQHIDLKKQLNQKLKQLHKTQQKYHNTVHLDKNTVHLDKLRQKQVRQLSLLQQQLAQNRKLLNKQLESYNKIEESRLQIDEGIERLQNRQNKLKTMIETIIKQQKDYKVCIKIEQQYQMLLNKKRQLVNSYQPINNKKHQQIYDKISAIQQSLSNMKEMAHYQQQLTFLIMQQDFIISQIQSRQQSNTIYTNKNNTKDYLRTNDKDYLRTNDKEYLRTNDNDQIDADQKLFQQEVHMLKKTIANRRFLEKRKNNALKKLEKLFYNNQTTQKNIDIQQNHNLKSDDNTNTNTNNTNTNENNNKNNNNTNNYNNNANTNENNNNYSSIFKILIQPISHSNPIKINRTKQSPLNKNQYEQNLSKHRNSMPSKLTKLTNTKGHFSNLSKSENKINDLSTIQIEVLEKILKNKQEYIQRLLVPQQKAKQLDKSQNCQHNSINKAMYNSNINDFNKIGQTSHINKDLLIGPDSRFIQKLIQSKVNNNNRQQKKMNTTNFNNSNVRIRTKKSQSQKLNRINQMRKRVNFSIQKGVKSRVLSQSKSYLENSKSNKINHKKFQLLDGNNVKANQNTTKQQSKQYINGQIKKVNNFNQENKKSKQLVPIFNSSNQSKYNKYKDKIFQLQHEKNSIDNVFKKIEQIKRSQQIISNNNENKSSKMNIKKSSNKIKVIKLSSARKYGNSLAFQRKGTALGVELQNDTQSQQYQQQQVSNQSNKQNLRLLDKIQQQQQSIRNTFNRLQNE